MAEETQLTASTGLVTISTANTKTDGTGTLGTVLTGASPGTIIKRIFIKAQTNTTRGMIRLFVYNGSSTLLLKEIDVFPITKTGTNPAFETVVELDFVLKESFVLKASTEKGETFNIIAEAMNWSYYATSVRSDTTQFTGVIGNNSMSTANSNLDGTGTLAQVYSAGSSGTYKGSIVDLISIKSDGNVTSGMVRLFIYNSTTNFLIKEIPVNTVTQSALDESFEYYIDFDGGFYLQAGYIMKLSTENAETFKINGSGRDYNYAS